MNYTVNGKIYTADEGCVFQSKKTGIISKVLRFRSPEMLVNYDVIPEPVPEPIPEEVTPETPVDEEATESDYINALEELGVSFDE